MSRLRSHVRFLSLLSLLFLMICTGGVFMWSRQSDVLVQVARLQAWRSGPAAYSAWRISLGDRCDGAPMIMPTTGLIGFGWGDSFRPGHQHSGFDIFSPDGAENVTPIVAAHDGYLTRESDWLSTVIIRHPDFEIDTVPETIWTYYTHMASANGSLSYVDPAFPPGTYEQWVTAGTLLGYQGTWSGRANVPTGLHLHFSVVKSTPSGGYANETILANTLDPAPFLGLTRDEKGVYTCPNTSTANEGAT